MILALSALVKAGRCKLCMISNGTKSLPPFMLKHLYDSVFLSVWGNTKKHKIYTYAFPCFLFPDLETDTRNPCFVLETDTRSLYLQETHPNLLNFHVPECLLGNIKKTSPRFLNDFIKKNKHICVFTVSFQKHTHVSMSESNLAGNTCAMAIRKGYVLGNIEAFPGLCPLSVKSCLWVHENTVCSQPLYYNGNLRKSCMAALLCKSPITFLSIS